MWLENRENSKSATFGDIAIVSSPDITTGTVRVPVGTISALTGILEDPKIEIKDYR